MEKKATFKNALIGGLASGLKPKTKTKTATKKYLAFPAGTHFGKYKGKNIKVLKRPQKQNRVKDYSI
jgi:hypothetical protein|tara:strand:- start:60 stop:260 length:201 start_codon:yes stop_codon:yes gene_type:complete